MRVASIEITLEELQDALRQYVVDRIDVDATLPDTVVVVSHDKRITVELGARGIVAADEFRHRA